MILLDTSGLLAAMFSDQNRHEECARALLAAEPPRIISPFVLSELDYLIVKYAGVHAEMRLFADIYAGAYELASFERQDLHDAATIVKRYESLKVGLADASTVILAERHRCRDVLTLDERHFRAMKPSRRSFRILPADA